LPKEDPDEPEQNEVLRILEVPLDQDLSDQQAQRLFALVLNFVRRNQPDLWLAAVDDIKLLIKSEPVASYRHAETELEQTCSEYQKNLITLRQSVAQAIATEKQLEQQIQKNKLQAETWQQRADFAQQQKNDDLVEQASQRKVQHVNAVEDLERELREHAAKTVELRARLTEVEVLVQQMYTKKQVLIARHKAAEAATKANAILARFNSDEALAAFAKVEQQIVEMEQKLGRDVNKTSISSPDLMSAGLLRTTIEALQQSTSIMEKLEERLMHGHTADSEDPS
jgi:phage shock protein A